MNSPCARQRRGPPLYSWQLPRAGRSNRASHPSSVPTTGVATVDDEHQEPASTEPGTPSPPPSLGGHDPSPPRPRPRRPRPRCHRRRSRPAEPGPDDRTLGLAPRWRPGPPDPADGAVGTGPRHRPRRRPVPPYGGPPPTTWPPAALVPPPPPPRPGRTSPRWLVVAVVAALIGGAVGAGIAEAVGTGGSHGRQRPIRVGSASPGPALAGNASIPSIVKQILPEVVSIDAKGPASSGCRRSLRPVRGPAPRRIRERA